MTKNPKNNKKAGKNPLKTITFQGTTPVYNLNMYLYSKALHDVAGATLSAIHIIQRFALYYMNVATATLPFKMHGRCKITNITVPYIICIFSTK